jgi:hypothetical protein
LRLSSLKYVHLPSIQNTLLKLQSLLCSVLLDVSPCRATALAFLEMYPDVVGSLSLRVLSCGAAEAIPLLCKHRPEVLLAYAKQQRKGNVTNAEWRLLLTCLQVEKWEKAI